VTRQQAHALVVALRAAFAVPVWDQATVDLYVNKVETLKDADLAQQVISNLIDSEEFRPTIAKVMKDYLALSRRQREQRAETHGLNLPDLTPEEILANIQRVNELTEKVGFKSP